MLLSTHTLLLAVVLVVVVCFQGANAVGSVCPRVSDISHPVRTLVGCETLMVAGKLKVSGTVNCSVGFWPPDISARTEMSVIDEIRVFSGGVLYVTVLGWVRLETDIIEVEDGGELYFDGTGHGGRVESALSEACFIDGLDGAGVGGASATIGGTLASRGAYQVGTMLDTSSIFGGRGGCETSLQTSKHSNYQGGAALHIDAASFIALGIVDMRFDGCITEFVNPLVSNIVGGGAGGGVVFSVPVMSGHFSVSVNGADPTLGENAVLPAMGGSGGLILVDSTSTLNINYTMDAVGRGGGCGGGCVMCVGPHVCVHCSGH